MPKRSFILAVMLGLLLGLSIILFNFARAFILRPASPNPSYDWIEIANGFKNPLYLTHAGDGSERLFVVEQGGLIRILQNGAVLEKPFLDLTTLVSRDGSEQGLLGLAFHPSYTDNGKFFVN